MMASMSREPAPSDGEEGLRTIRYLRYDGMWHPDPVECVDSLLGFAYAVVQVSVFPPFHILNQLFRQGGHEGGMGPGMTWKPFSIAPAEYDHLIAALRSVPVDTMRARGFPVVIPFFFDPSFDHHQEYWGWLAAVCEKYRAQWHSELKAWRERWKAGPER
jgi:hypothetical protein